MYSCFRKTGFGILLLGFSLCFQSISAQPTCPSLQQDATFTATGCASGVTPCTLCPGAAYTLIANGQNLQPGACINWYYGNSDSFNPYNGEGTLLGCAEITTLPPNPCAVNGCPIILGILVDACGTEENNEILALWSGSGFAVGSATLDFDPANNGPNANDQDIGGGCNWQAPNANVVSSIQSACPGVVVVGAGPGETVPPGVPVLVFTSAGYNFNYNFASLCALAPVIYVLQNGCARTVGAFSNGTSSGPRTTTFGLNCGCSWSTTYNCGALNGGDGAYVRDGGFPIFYGNSGCDFPTIPAPPGGGSSPIVVPAFTDTIAAGLCNNGPYWAVGIVSPLQAGCSPTFTNYLPFDVRCASATLTLVGPDTICAGSIDSLRLEVTGGAAPYTFVYSINGLQQSPVTTSENPYTFSTPFLSAGTNIFNLDSIEANTCLGTISGEDTLVVLPLPRATIPTDTISLCHGEMDSLLVKLSGPGPYTFRYSLNNDTLPAITIADTLYKIPFTTSPGFSVYKLVSLVGGNCNGLLSGTFGVNVGTAPTAALTGDTMICAGETTPLTITFTGTPPFITHFEANNVPQTPDTSLFNPRIILVSPSVPTFYKLTSVSSNGCTGTATGTATVNTLPNLSATLSGGGQICQSGTGTTLTVTFQGPGPYTFVYSSKVGGQPAILQPPVVTTENPYLISVNPPVGTVYQLVSVTNGTCAGTISGVAVVAVFTPSTATLSQDLTFCNAADTSLIVDFTGSGPFELLYAIDNVAQPLVETFDDPYLIPVNVTTTTTFTLLSVESPGCVGMVTGNIESTVTVNYPPSYANVKLNCNFAAGTYTVEFDAIGAALPLTLITGSGSFAGTHFTSTAISVVQGYNFVFHDANDCGDITVSGPATCNCTSNAGTMNLTPLGVCMGTAPPGIHHSNAVLDADDVLRFILHTNPALPIGQVLAWNTTPAFTFGAGMLPNTTYYISAVAGNAEPGGNIDLNDPCLSVSQGVPVVFYELPTARFDSIGAVCPGDTVLIPVLFTGAPPFAFTYSIDGVAQTPVINIGTTSYALNVPVAGAPTLIINSVTDLHCTNLSGDTLAPALIPSPQLSNLNIRCDFADDTYSVEFDVTGTPPFSASGTLGFFTGNHFTSLPVPSGMSYSISITDANLCGTATFDSIHTCVCITQAGTMNPTALEGCAGSPLNAAHNNDQTLDPDGGLVFMLHTAGGTALGAVLDIQNQPVFNFNPATMKADSTYYISAVAGNADTNGNIDINDPCLSVSAGTPVLWHSRPTASMDANFDVCPGETVQIPVTFTGTAPFMFTYTNNNLPNNVIALQNAFSISATLLQTAVFQAVSVSDVNCPGTASGQAAVNVHQAPEITAINVSCAPDNLSYVIEFDVANADLTTAVISGSVTGILDPNTGHFISDPVAPQTGYNVLLSDAWQCGLDSISGGANCACVTSAGLLDQTPLSLCLADTARLLPATGFFLAPDDTLVYALVSSPSPTTWNILAFNDQPVFPFDPAFIAPGTTYYIAGLAANATPAGIDLNDLCLSYALGPSVVWKPQASALLGADTEICQGDTTTLVVSFSGNGPFDFTYQVNGVDQQVQSFSGTQYLLAVAPAGTTTYSLTSVSTQGCPGSGTGTAVVTVQERPQILNAVTVCDLSTETYRLEFSIGNGAAPNPAYSVSGVAGALTDSVFVSAPIPSGQLYTVVVSTPSGCTASATGTAICLCTTDAGTLSPSGPLSICLPDTAVASANNDAVLESGDTLQFILFQNPATLPMGILAINNIPRFGFQAGMQTEQTYYIAAIAGDRLPDGTIDMNDPCLSVSSGVPVVFHNRPTATLDGDTTVCSGADVKFKIVFTGKSPFQFVYAINGSPQTAIAAPQNVFSISSNNILLSQKFTLVSVLDAFCTGAISGFYDVVVQAGPKGSVLPNTTICPGDTATLTLQLEGAPTFDLRIDGEAAPILLNGVQNGATFTVAPVASTVYSIGSLIAHGNVCPATIDGSATVTVAPQLQAIATLSDYSGFNVSCPGETDGSISLQPVGGIAPVTALWSNNASSLSIDNLAAGPYSVTLTDNIGCDFSATFDLIEPPGLAVSVSTKSPGCFDEKTGALSIQNVQGGIGPYTISLDNKQVQITDLFPVEIPDLAAGTYQIGVADINGCETTQEAILENPPKVTVGLGPDTSVYFGDSVFIEAITAGAVIDTFAWSPLSGISDPTSLLTSVKPEQTMVYKIWVRDTAGCSAEDELLISVRRDKRIYFPEVFKPGAVGENGTFTVYAGPEVVRLRTFRIYDRWGECVFENPGITPNQPTQGWTGLWRGKASPPGVYVYVVELEYFDGTTEIMSGDVTLIR